MDKHQAATNNIQELIKNLMILEDMHPIIRVVDPIHKSVFSIKDNGVEEEKTNCHDFWVRDKVCDNCISMRAYNANETLVKIDYSPEKVFMVTAVPVPLGEGRVVVEVMKDVTTSMYISGESIENNTEFRTLIDHLSKAVYKDALTDVFNQRFVGERLPVDLVECRAMNQPLSLIMCDLDYFKQVNDTYGHVTGDYLLQTIAKMLFEKAKLHKGWIARYGGEEFLICLPYAHQKLAVEFAEMIRETVEQTEYRYEGNSLKATMSCGVYTLSPGQHTQSQQLIEYADQCLYEAKRTGRNKMVAAGNIVETVEDCFLGLEKLISNSTPLSYLDLLKIGIAVKEDACNNYLTTAQRLFQVDEQAFFKQLAENETQHVNVFNQIYDKKKHDQDSGNVVFDESASNKLKVLIKQHNCFEDRMLRAKKTGTIFGDFTMIRKAIQWKLDFYEMIKQYSCGDDEVKTVFNHVALEEKKHNSEFEKKINEFMYR